MRQRSSTSFRLAGRQRSRHSLVWKGKARLPKYMDLCFDGLPLRISRGVFVPQPASEAVVAAATAAPRTHLVLDIGTGSGALALALASRKPGSYILGSDTSRRAIRCARTNSSRLGLKDVQFAKGSLLEPARRNGLGGVDLVMANLPTWCEVPTGALSPPRPRRMRDRLTTIWGWPVSLRPRCGVSFDREGCFFSRSTRHKPTS